MASRGGPARASIAADFRGVSFSAAWHFYQQQHPIMRTLANRLATPNSPSGASSKGSKGSNTQQQQQQQQQHQAHRPPSPLDHRDAVMQALAVLFGPQGPAICALFEESLDARPVRRQQTRGSRRSLEFQPAAPLLPLLRSGWAGGR